MHSEKWLGGESVDHDAHCRKSSIPTYIFYNSSSCITQHVYGIFTTLMCKKQLYSLLATVILSKMMKITRHCSIRQQLKKISGVYIDIMYNNVVTEELYSNIGV